EETFSEYLNLDPNAELDPNLSPKILEAFQAAKARLFAPEWVQLRGESGPGAAVRVLDPWRRVERGVLRWKEGEGRWEEKQAGVQDGIARAALPPAGGELYWYLEARDRAGEPVARFGSASAPFLRLARPRPASQVTSPASSARPGTPRLLGWVASGAAVA